VAIVDAGMPLFPWTVIQTGERIYEEFDTAVLNRTAEERSDSDKVPEVVHNPLLAQMIRRYQAPPAQLAPAPTQSRHSREPFGFD
jgi:hypothetical protein